MTIFATGPSVEKLREAIAKFYCRDNLDEVKVDGEKVILSGKHMASVKVTRKRKRFVFESYYP